MKRSLLAGIGLALCGFLIAPPPTQAADEKPIRCLFVAGGCCHDYAAQPGILAKGIGARTNIEFVVAYDDDKGTKHLNPVYEKEDWYKGFDIIIHDECTADVTDQKMIDRVLEPHKHGLPAVNLHCAMHCYRGEPFPKTTPWMEFTGMNTNHHGQQRPIEITFTETSDPIVKGMENWTTINEELYHATELLPTSHALATGHQNVSKEADAPVIWTNDYHGTRVFSTTLGHNNKTVNDPRYLDLVTRGLLWSLNKLDDAHLKKVEH
jgi:type 1 glutamine amidotransferase